jgi:hypothetical protein
MVNISAITFQNHLFDYLETVQQEEGIANCLQALDQTPPVIPPSQKVEEIMAWLNKTDCG